MNINNSQSTPSVMKRIRQRFISLYRNLTVSEISGSLGDLGTLLPLLVALSSQRSIQLAPALFFGGVANVITGFVWDVPMCVQPMKSIAAVALSEGWNSSTVTAAGFITGAVVFLLGITSFIDLVNKIVPGNVVSGLQIGVGVRLASKGIQMVGDLNWIDGYDSILLGVLCAALCLFWLRESYSEPTERQERICVQEDGETNINVLQRKSFVKQILSCCLKPFKVLSSQQHPVGIYLFVIGVLFASITLATTKNENNQYDLPLQFFGAPVASWAMGNITAEEYWIGFTEGAIPQLPLTTLNSVISVCALAHSLYPEKRQRNHPSTSNDAVISRKDVAISVGLMNIVFCPFGSMPNCHGAGGLAGQHRLGARHGTSVVFLGIGKIALAIFLGKSALTLLDAFPTSVLGVMLAIAGQELATTGFTLLVKSVEDAANEHIRHVNENEEQEEEESRHVTNVAKFKTHLLRQNTVIAVITAMVIISTGKTHYGALSGWVAHMIYGGGISDVISWCGSRHNHTHEDAFLSPTQGRTEDENDEIESEFTHDSSTNL